MAKGIKIVRPKKEITTDNPLSIVLDTTDKGSLKISQVVRFKTSDLDSTRLNGSGVSVGKKIIPHGLGYSPAFLGFIYGSGYNQVAEGQSYLLPASGPLGGPDLEILSDTQNVTVDGITVPTGGATADSITVVIFAETLDN